MSSPTQLPTAHPIDHSATCAAHNSQTCELSRWALGGSFLLGLLAAVIQVHSFATVPNGVWPASHEGFNYPLRVIEFRDCIDAGYLSPQWCTHFRNGFGSPYFGYYQSGFFYVAASLPKFIGLKNQIVVTLSFFSLIGYWFTFLAAARHNGLVAGIVAGITLTLAQYGLTNLYFRGDLSEFSAMNIIPAILYYLDGWLNFRRLRDFAGVAISSSALVFTHPCITLATFGYLALYLSLLSFWPQRRGASLGAMAALAVGVGMSAMYWFPVIFEWELASIKNAFAGNYFFGHHFTEPLALVISGDAIRTPANLGLTTWGLICVSVITVTRNWRNMTSPQRQFLAMSTGLFVYSVFLMSSFSSPIWSHAPLLYRLQFPWRLLALISVAVAFLVGCQSQQKSSTLSKVVSGWLVLNMCYFSMFDSRREFTLLPFDETRSATEIEKLNFAPDLENEWLPRGATADPEKLSLRTTRASEGAIAQHYEQAQGCLTCSVETDRESTVRLPHYYFPGWAASINNVSLAIQSDEDGFMQVALPANCNGMMKVQFSMSPMRRMGIVISLISFSLLLGIIGLSLLKRLCGTR